MKVASSVSIALGERFSWVAVHPGHAVPDFPVRCGVTAEATAALSGGIRIDLPPVRTFVTAGQVCGRIRSETSNVAIHAPVSGLVTIHNPEIVDAPDLVVLDPVSAGWLFAVMVDNPVRPCSTTEGLH